MPLEDHLLTEALNPESEGIDRLDALGIVRLMNRQDARVVEAVAAVGASIAEAIRLVAGRFRDGGRLIYVGAGTSGRLGVLDASECPPTFSTPPSMVVGLIAGGPTALTRAVEGAEDSPELGAKDLDGVEATARDVVVGIATSGRTPYVLGAVDRARAIGAPTVGIACNRPSLLGERVDLEIAPLVGPEVIAGSTRLKAGTATKMVLNMITTGAMVLIGKTYGNRMIDLQPTNQKLKIRSRRMLRELAGVDDEEAAVAAGGGQRPAEGGVDDGIIGRRRERRRGPAPGARRADRRGDRRRGRAMSGPLILGVDGGGTTTIAWLADADGNVIGRGKGGPSNVKAVGDEQARASLNVAIREARREAGHERSTIAVACLGLAGFDRPEDRSLLEIWSDSDGWASSLVLVNDGDLVVAAGTPAGSGIALIAGTGSIAVGRAPTAGRPAPAAGATWSATRAAATGSPSTASAWSPAAPTAAPNRRPPTA